MKRIESIRLLLMDQILTALTHVSTELERKESRCKIDVTNNDFDSYVFHKKEYDLLSKEIALLEELDDFYCEHFESL